MDLVATIDIRSQAPGELEALDSACRDHGFFLLKGHGLDELIDRTFAESWRFFAASEKVKAGIARTEDEPLGWYDRELTKRYRDCKEVFDYMEPKGAIGQKKNRWPEELPGFREMQDEFFEAFSKLAGDTSRLIHRALATPGEFMRDHLGSVMTSTVRLNYYPVEDPVPADERAGLPELGETALGFHTDPGVLTLLLQDETGGLQAFSRGGTWIDVPPRSGTIVVNLGDTFQVWSNDRYRAAVHRVIPMRTRGRYSIPYFYNPNFDQVIEPIAAPGEAAARYRPFTWREFIQARVDDNFSDLGTEDTQASHYRIV